jgi:hypothetical protein
MTNRRVKTRQGVDEDEKRKNRTKNLSVNCSAALAARKPPEQPVSRPALQFTDKFQGYKASRLPKWKSMILRALRTVLPLSQLRHRALEATILS